MGLINAVDRYDPEAGPFVRYAVPTILGELKRHFRDKGWTMRVPRSLQERTMVVTDDRRSSTRGSAARPHRGTSRRTPELTWRRCSRRWTSRPPTPPPRSTLPWAHDEEGERTLGDTLG